MRIEIRKGRLCWLNADSELHREDGPAIEYTNGTKQWWVNGKLHREDGPAVEWASGTKHWYINGMQLAQEGLRAKVE